MGQIKQSKVSEEDALKEAEEMLKRLEEQKNLSTKLEASKESVEQKDEKTVPTSFEEESESRPVSVGKEPSKEDKKVEKKSAISAKKSVYPERSRGAKSAGPKVRSKKYQEKYALVDRSKLYNFDEALELVKKTSYVKFDASVEMHARLVAPKTKKTKQEQVRNTVQLPHSIGKEPKVGVIDETMAEKILKEKKTEFDILLATPDMMPKIARLAKILGPQGKMPNPKTGTVTTDVEKTLKEIKSGRVEYKSDDTGNIHQMLGKVSFDNKKLEENYRAIMSAIGVNKIQSVTLSATMGPGVRVKL